MEKKDYRLFVDSDTMDPLPPIYKGKKITIYPGQLVKEANFRDGRTGSAGQFPRSNKSRLSGLRRYIFRYEGDKFVYLATRKGQRNGGFNSKPSQTRISINFLVPNITNVIENTFTFTEINDDNEEIWTSSNFNRIKYNALSNRWEWQTRPVPPTGQQPGQFFINAYTQSTSNPLKDTSSADQIQWTYVNDPWNTATPEVPITVTEISALVYYNNNSLENLNKWPIKNVDADREYDQTDKKWQARDVSTGNLIPDRRPDDLNDEYLKKCFQGVNLKHYDIVFVEVVWKYFAVRNAKYDIENSDNLVNWGYQENFAREEIHDVEWWSPKPFEVKRQKGRVYRIGILEADTGIGGFDKVLFAQRTRVITTDYRRGGETALQ